VDALAAPIAREIARTALAALGFSGDPFHEPFHDRKLTDTGGKTAREELIRVGFDGNAFERHPRRTPRSSVTSNKGPIRPTPAQPGHHHPAPRRGNQHAAAVRYHARRPSRHLQTIMNC
jgi:hypothetical protein